MGSAPAALGPMSLFLSSLSNVHFSDLEGFWEVLRGQNGGQNRFFGCFFAMFFWNVFLHRFLGGFLLVLEGPSLDFCAHSQCFRTFSQNRRFRKKW